MMGLLEYANRVVPDITKKSIPAFYNRDPLMKLIYSRNLVKRSGGSVVRILRIKNSHSEVSEINGTNLSVDMGFQAVDSAMTGDWTKYIKPIVFPHPTRDRMQSREDMQRWVKDTNTAAMTGLKNDVSRRVYVGNVTGKKGMLGLGTLNGNKTNGTSSGFANGAIRFQTPTAQAAAAITYLNDTRVEDTTNFEDNWYNQFKAHTGIGTDALDACSEAKTTADTFSEEDEGVAICIMSIADHIAFGAEVRSYPGGGGQAAVLYTVDDVEKGRVHKLVHRAAGMDFYPNRWMTAAAVGSTGAIYGLNPSTVEWWVNANNDFRTTKITDRLEVSNQDVDAGFIVLEAQFAINNLLANFGASQ